MPLYRKKFRVKTHRVLPKKRLIKTIKSVVSRKLETKCFENFYASAALAVASPVIIPISNVAQGDGEGARTGLQIEPTRLQAKVVVKANGAVPLSCVRCQIIKFKQCDGTLPTLANILPLSSATPADLAVEMPYAVATAQQDKRKFEVLYDRVKWIASATDDGNYRVATFNVSKRLKGKTYFTGANGTDEGNNQYYIFIHTDGTDADIARIFTTRFYFKDA